MARRKPRAYTRQAQARRARRSMRWAMLLLVAAGAVFIAAKIMAQRHKDRAAIRDIENLTYVKTPSGINEQIVEYKGMTVSFNPDLHIPNWVAWELTADEAAGSEPRYNKFAADPDVEGCPAPDDYRNSGYDKGHMAPAGDMKWDNEAMRQTFYLTNIVPQDGALNRGTWKNIEEKCRARAARDSAVVIVCGPVPGEKPREYIGNGKVAVPRRFFKVILSPYAATPQAIGFVMDNGKVAGGMQAAAVTVDHVEAITGYDFFSALPDSMENALESTVNFNRWSRLK